MAFGSFFKKIINGAKNIIGKVVPAVKKGLDAVSKIAPKIAAGATAFGGPIGATIGTVADTVGRVAGGFSQFLNNPTSSNQLKSSNNMRLARGSTLLGEERLGANGSGIRDSTLLGGGAGRFAVPMLK